MHEYKNDFKTDNVFGGFYCTILSFQKLGEMLTTALLDTGANIIRDVAKGKNSRESLQTQGKQIRLEMFNKVNT